MLWLFVWGIEGENYWLSYLRVESINARQIIEKRWFDPSCQNEQMQGHAFLSQRMFRQLTLVDWGKRSH